MTGNWLRKLLQMEGRLGGLRYSASVRILELGDAPEPAPPAQEELPPGRELPSDAVIEDDPAAENP